MKFRALGLAIYLMSVAGTAVAAPAADPAATGPHTDPSGLLGQVAHAATALEGGQCQAAEWQAIAAAPGFVDLPSMVKSITDYALAICVGGPNTRTWLEAATAEPEAYPPAWGARAIEELRRDDVDAALASIEAGATASVKAGSELQLSDQAVSYLVRKTRPRLDQRKRFVLALDRGRWSPEDPAFDPSWLWREAALAFLADGRVAEAQRAAGKVTDPRELFGMTLDKRFDAVVAADPAHFDVPKALQAALERQQAAYAKGANDTAAYQIIDDLRVLGRFPEALAVADTTLQKPQIQGSRGEDYRNWIEDRKAYVLMDMGRFDEAVTVERTAAGKPEYATKNVSQAINLAGMLDGAGRPAEALASLAEVGKASDYGLMWASAERVCANAALGRREALKRDLQFTSEHEKDNRGARLKAALCVDDAPAATQVVVDWLGDPEDRTTILVDLSVSRRAAVPTFDRVIQARFDKVRGSEEVRRAVAEVGRTADLPLYTGAWSDVD